jgi:hypothetical protein
MNRLSLLIACLAAAAADTCLAADPAECLATCTSEQRQCQGGAKPQKDRLMAAAPAPDWDRHAQGAQVGHLSGRNVLGTDNSVAAFKRLARDGACEASFTQCSRDCGRAPGAGAGEAGKDDRHDGQAG